MDQPTTGGFITVWSSSEEPGSYKKTRATTFKESCWPKDNSIKVATRCKIDFQPSAVMVLAATGKIDKSGFTISPINMFIPSDMQTITPQSPYIGAKSFLEKLKYNGYAVPYGLPVCTPIVLSKVVPESVKTLKCKLTNIRKHSPIIGLAKFDMVQIGMCSRTINGTDAFIFENDNSVTINLDKIPDVVTYITFGLIGDMSLRKEPPNESKIPGVVIPRFGDLTPSCQLQANGKYSLQDFVLPAARDRNSFKWFTLFREPFGKWAILSIRIPTMASGEKELINKMIDTTKLLI
jgi:hypothetical protein